jgi:hypothetical protein
MAATIRFGSQQSAVTIRNLSATGAMLDGSLAPEAGSDVVLSRGSLEAPAEVVWCAQGRMGLRFSGEIAVDKWLASRGQTGQVQVDRIVSDFKSGRPSSGLIASPSVTTESISNIKVADSLKLVATMLSELEDELSSSQEILSAHGEKLQSLDLANQMLQALAEVVVNANKSCAHKVNSLRVACRKATRTL